MECALALYPCEHTLVRYAVEAYSNVVLGVLEEVETLLEILLCSVVTDDMECQRAGTVHDDGLKGGRLSDNSEERSVQTYTTDLDEDSALGGGVLREHNERESKRTISIWE